MADAMSERVTKGPMPTISIILIAVAWVSERLFSSDAGAAVLFFRAVMRDLNGPDRIKLVVAAFIFHSEYQ